MKCTYCNTELRGGAKFCPKCGNKVVIQESVVEEKTTIICEKCGTEYEKEFVVCPSCGNIYEEKQTEIQEAPNTPVCQTCGKEIVPGKAFCKYCGTKLSAETNPSKLNDADQHLQPLINQGHATQNCTENNFENSDIGFISLNEFLIDEKVSAFKFANSYKVYDMSGSLVGAIIQDAVSGGAAAARVLMGKNTKALQKFGLTIVSSEGEKLGRIYRDGGGFATIYVENATGQNLISMKLRLGKLSDENGNMVCKFGVGFTTVPLKDEIGNELATVTWKWNGAKSIFTTSDKYRVTLSPTLSGNKRFIIMAITCAYDMLAGDR